MNITISDDSIFSIPYIYQVPSKYHISEQFPMENYRKIYVLDIDNEEPSLASTDVQLIWDK